MSGTNPNSNGNASPTPQQMMEEINKLRGFQQQAQQQLAAAQHEVELMRKSTQEGSRIVLGSGVRLPPIDSFRGNKPNTVNAFLRDIERQCNYSANIVNFPLSQPHLRVDLAVNHLQGAAADWWDSLSIETKNAARGSWDRFCEVMRTRFQPVQAAELARARLRVLKQKSGSVSKYTEEFLRELNPIRHEMHANDQVFYYKEGLYDRRIHDKIVENRPASLEAAIDLAVQWEAQYARGRILPISYMRPFVRSSSSSSSSGPVPMELSAITDIGDEEDSESDLSILATTTSEPTSRERLLLNQIEAIQKKYETIEKKLLDVTESNRVAALGKGRVPNRSKEDVARLMRDGRCINCCGKGHMKKDCKSKWQPMPKNL
jgi:hypothetical protein